MTAESDLLTAAEAVLLGKTLQSNFLGSKRSANQKVERFKHREARRYPLMRFLGA
jgi:hypothetical protein